MGKDDPICIGHISGVHGVKGWVKCYSNTSPRENIVNYSPWLLELDAEFKPLDIKGKCQGKNVIAQLDGINDRTSAEQLIGTKLYIQAGQLQKLSEGEYYWNDLRGLQVINQVGEILGNIDSIMETGANDVMIVQGDRKRLIPFVMNEIVKEVNLDTGVLVVDWQLDY